MTIYGLERLLYRLSISPFSHQFVLKGGVLLYAIYQGKFARGTADIDLLCNDTSTNAHTIQTIFSYICKIDYPSDGLVFDATTIRVSQIGVIDKFRGVNFSIYGYLDRTKILVSIDIGFGDIVYPKTVTIRFPALVDDISPFVQAYSIESIIAEKFEVIVSRGKANSRMKDFYDIWLLSESFDFDITVLAEACKLTFYKRNISLNNIVFFDENFADEPNLRSGWVSFVKSKNVNISDDFKFVTTRIKNFLFPVVALIRDNTNQKAAWLHQERKWNHY